MRNIRNTELFPRTEKNFMTDNPMSSKKKKALSEISKRERNKYECDKGRTEETKSKGKAT